MVKTTYSGKPPIVAAVAFVILALASRRWAPMPGDLWLALRIQRWQARIPMEMAHFGNWLGSAAMIGLVAALIAIAFAAGHCWREAAFVLAAFAAKALNSVLKSIVDAPRPSASLIRVSEHASSSGFPSGHVMGVTLVLGTAALMLSRRAPRYGALAWSAAALGIVITAFGRVWVGAHWPAQTLGGFLAAIGLLGLLDRAAREVWEGGGASMLDAVRGKRAG